MGPRASGKRSDPGRGRAGRLADADSAPLRLTVSGGELGLEAYETLPLGALRIEDLAWSLPNLKFPVDLSGGVEMFRNRRGALRRLTVFAGRAELEKHLSARVRGAMGSSTSLVTVWAVPDGLGVGLWGEAGTLAFELLWAAGGNEARLIVGGARSGGDLEVPLAHALRIAETVLGPAARRRGRVLTIDACCARVCKMVAPALGARSPSAHGVTVGPLEAYEDGFRVRARSAQPAEGLSSDVLRALELALLCVDADDCLARGDLEGARRHYVAALERAPRHRELVQLVAQIDAASGIERAEAALGMLVDCLPATEFGLTGATLLARVGDAAGARRAVASAAEHEVYAPLAASAWQRLAELAEDEQTRRAALDRAVGAAPALHAPRWARIEARIAWGDEQGALADAQHLEAAAQGARGRHEILMRCAELLARARRARAAGKLYERALRYLPADPDATLGLALALRRSGKDERATALLQRAVALADEQGRPCGKALIELARHLAEGCGDHPQAVARLGMVPRDSDSYLEACALQGRFRAALGDLQGASLAFADLRQGCELAVDKSSLAHASPWLVEAARFASSQLSDLAAAERHLATALRLTPHSRAVRARYRQVAARLARRESGGSGS